MYLVTTDSLISGYGTSIDIVGLFNTLDDADKAIKLTRLNITRDPNFILWYKKIFKGVKSKDVLEPLEWLESDGCCPIEFTITEVEPNKIYSVIYSVGDLHLPDTTFMSFNRDTDFGDSKNVGSYIE